MPGMTSETWFIPQKAGTFEIACAEHCGLGHYRMRGQVQVVPPAELEARIKETAGE
jgi:cytochrome c oxidase subunit 2